MNSNFKKSFSQSLFFHALLIVFVAGLTWLNPIPKTAKKYKFSVKEKTPEVQPQKETPPVALDITQQVKPIPKPIEPVKKVFGLNKNTITSNQAGAAVEVKAGNTISKEQDNDKLEGDADPIPVAEFLISRMPKVKKEIRPPYPPEARAQSIQGVVLMDILIDERGLVRTATIIQGLGYGLDEAALSAIQKFEFEPAQMDQKNVAVKIRYAYRFVLDE